MYLTCTISQPCADREFTAVDLADFHAKVTDAIDRFTDHAADPAASPDTTWTISQGIHIGHASDDVCTTDCQKHRWMTLGPLGEVRAALSEVEAYFAEHALHRSEISALLAKVAEP
jgi:hypothetical protein